MISKGLFLAAAKEVAVATTLTHGGGTGHFDSLSMVTVDNVPGRITAKVSGETGATGNVVLKFFGSSDGENWDTTEFLTLTLTMVGTAVKVLSATLCDNKGLGFHSVRLGSIQNADGAKKATVEAFWTRSYGQYVAP